jgi:hypothetical protein
MKNKITHPLALRALAKMAANCIRGNVLYTIDGDYLLRLRTAASFRESAACVTRRVIVLECTPGLFAIGAVGVSSSGACFLAVQNEVTDWAEPIIGTKLTPSRRLLVSHVIALIERTLMLHELAPAEVTKV